jgi:3-deoxy-D-manno-octulosonic-acid transferase
MGARYDNFRAVAEALLREHAVVITDPAGLRTTLAKLFDDSARRKAIGERGRSVFVQQAGATGRALSALLPLVGPAPARDGVEIVQVLR